MARQAKDTRWGYALADWSAAREQLRDALVSCARRRETASYSSLCESVTVARFRPYSWAFMALVEEVCAEEDAGTGVVLASLVVRKDSGLPGEGYFRWFERAGADTADRAAFWRDQADGVWEAYREQDSETGG